MKQFLKYLFASTLGTIVGFILIIFISGIILAGIVGSAIMMAGDKDKKLKIKPKTVLEIDLTTDFMERTPSDPFENLNFGGDDSPESAELQPILNAIKFASSDTNIKGILIRGAYFNGGLATMQTLRDHLVAFKDSSNKFIMAYEEAFTQGAYYVATAADEVYLFQEGMVDVRGLRTEIAFFKGAMDKLGIDAMIVKGPENIYKSAVEPFYREDMSEPNKEQMTRILQTIWNEMLDDITVSRGLTKEEINKIADDLAVKRAEDAVALKLIDGLVYYDQIESKLRAKLNLEDDAEIETINIAEYAPHAEKKAKKDDDKSWKLKDQVAVIYAVGGIESGEGNEEVIGSETLAEAIREARTDDDVKAIVLRVNSPGGSALASEVIWRETVLASEEKPFIVSFGDVAASGGYYISTHADRIFAMPTTITGSIGAFGILPKLNGFFKEKLGITFDGVKTNKYADMGSLARDMDEAEIALIQGYLDEVYTEFVAKVAEGRGTSYEMIDSIGRGRVWTGVDAINIGLVDEFGGLEDAVAYAAEMAELNDFDILELPEKKDPFEEFIKDFSGSTKAYMAGWVLGDEVEYFHKIEEIKRMHGIQTRMMYEIKVH